MRILMSRYGYGAYATLRTKAYISEGSSPWLTKRAVRMGKKNVLSISMAAKTSKTEGAQYGNNDCHFYFFDMTPKEAVVFAKSLLEMAARLERNRQEKAFPEGAVDWDDRRLKLIIDYYKNNPDRNYILKNAALEKLGYNIADLDR